MNKYRRIEVNAFRRRVTVVSGEFRPGELSDEQPAETSDAVSLSDTDTCEPVEPDSPEGQMILVEAVRALERRLSPAARAQVCARQVTSAPIGSNRKGFYLKLKSSINRSAQRLFALLERKNEMRNSNKVPTRLRLVLILTFCSLLSFLTLSPPPMVAGLPDQDAGLHFVGATSSGGLWHAIRKADRTWTSFGDVKREAGDRGYVVDTDIEVIGNSQDHALHLCATTSDGRLWHTIRKTDGTWQSFGNVKGQAGERGSFVGVGISSVVSELHVVGVNSDGELWHTIRKPDGSWLPFGNVKAQAGDRGRFQRVGLASTGELHVTGVTSNGGLWHAIRKSNGSWTPFGNVKNGAGDRGKFVDVDSVAVGSELHVSGVTSDGQLWHTIRKTDGSWTTFGNVKNQAGDRGSFIGVTMATSWAVADVHVSGVTSDGRLWHTIRNFNGPWAPFGDVIRQTGNPGSFRAVATDMVQTVIR